MGMYAKLRHVPAMKLKAAKEEPAKFYRNLYGIKGKTVDRKMLLQSLGQQLAAALQASPLGKEFRDLPEARRVAEATQQQRAADRADQQVLAQKMWELLPMVFALIFHG